MARAAPTVPPTPRPSSAAGFDYGYLDDAIRDYVLQRRDRIRVFFTQTQRNIIAIGNALLDVKGTLDHGEFGEWLETEFGWSARSAQYFMSIAREFGDKAEVVSLFEPDALRELAAKSTDDTVRERFVRQAESGQPVTAREVRDALGKTARRQSAAHVQTIGSQPTLDDVVEFLFRVRPDAAALADVRTEIGDYHPTDRADVAAWVAGWGRVFLAAAQSYPHGDEGGGSSTNLVVSSSFFPRLCFLSNG